MPKTYIFIDILLIWRLDAPSSNEIGITQPGFINVNTQLLCVSARVKKMIKNRKFDLLI